MYDSLCAGEFIAEWTGECQPTLLICGLPPALPGWRCSWWVGGSNTDGGPYMAG